MPSSFNHLPTLLLLSNHVSFRSALSSSPPVLSLEEVLRFNSTHQTLSYVIFLDTNTIDVRSCLGIFNVFQFSLRTNLRPKPGLQDAQQRDSNLPFQYHLTILFTVSSATAEVSCASHTPYSFIFCVRFLRYFEGLHLCLEL